jgi:hypothetical protein
MRNYSIFYKESYAPESGWEKEARWDFFVSSFNASERVRRVYDAAVAGRKIWVFHNEYDLAPEQLPDEPGFTSAETNEGEFVIALLSHLKASGFDAMTSSLCIDITGMVRPHLMFLVRMIERMGVKKFDILYSEPDYYKRKGATSFSGGSIRSVRQVRGFEGISAPDPGTDARDLLVIGMGFDAQLIKEVAEDKDKADKIQLFGLPSLRADMYQQAVLRSREVADFLGDPNFAPSHRATAPANDPFVTATVLSETIEFRQSRRPPANLYLCPLGTKAQVLGFTLFYIGECLGQPRSILFPFSTRYSPETTQGLSRVWRYTVEFPLF